MSIPEGRNLYEVERTGRYVWYAFLVTPFVYVGVAYLLMQGRQEGPVPPFSLPTLRIALLCVAIFCFFGAFWLRHHAASRGLGDPRLPAGPVLPAFIFPWAVLEAIALFGLILVVLGGRMTDAITFAAIAFVGLLRMPPEGQGRFEEGTRRPSHDSKSSREAPF